MCPSLFHYRRGCIQAVGFRGVGFRGLGYRVWLPGCDVMEHEMERENEARVIFVEAVKKT